jgi:RNA polymerase sigma-70 factor, ECF subfamily
LPVQHFTSSLARENNVVALHPQSMTEPGSRDTATPREAEAAAIQAALTGCQAGDPSALADLYRLFRKEALHYIRYAVRNGHEAEDILQEVFVEIARTVRLFEGRSSFSSWLRRVCVRTAVRHMKRRHRQMGEESPDAERLGEGVATSSTADARLESKDKSTRVRELLEQIAPKKRMVLVLHDLEGTSPKEISKLVGAPVLTVRTRLFYARRELAALAAADPTLSEYFVR